MIQMDSIKKISINFYVGALVINKYRSEIYLFLYIKILKKISQKIANLIN